MSRRLWAIGDVHVRYPANRAALERIGHYGQDWLILLGDVGETEGHLAYALRILRPKFERLIWCPGNHDLWTMPRATGLKGVAKYESLLRICKAFGVTTPEDDYLPWPDDPRILIAPLLLLYDYSFRPADVPLRDAVAWAARARVACADEALLAPDPYPSVVEWCQARLASTAARLQAAVTDPSTVTILANHFPLRPEMAVLRQMPEFSIWCGTRETMDWHRRFRALVVLNGHMHVRRQLTIDGCPFKDVSLGYPAQWTPALGIDRRLHQVLPALEPTAANQESLHAAH